MSDPDIVYEQPLSERIRTFLRLEFLFGEAVYRMTGESPWDSRAAVARLLEIVSLLSRGDLRQEAIKELERHATLLSRLEQSPKVDHARLKSLLEELQGLSGALHGNGAFAQPLRDNEFLLSIRQRSAIPGGTCEFDLPAYHHWLNRAPEQRSADIRGLMATLEPLRNALAMVLGLIRESSVPSDELAVGGMFKKSLERNTPCHLVRVILPADAVYFPEISGNKHRFTIRFLEQPALDRRPVPTKQDIPFHLVCCVF